VSPWDRRRSPFSTIPLYCRAPQRAEPPTDRADSRSPRLPCEQKESTLHLVLRLRGGAKKRKKKTYTKPKKNKHKRKKNKLAFLAFYKVDDSGKVTRLRKECPSPECGAGVFMANHFDRHYCGKCGLTYVYEPDSSAPAPKGGKTGKGSKPAEAPVEEKGKGASMPSLILRALTVPISHRFPGKKGKK
jgi:ribosomal protein S27AE